SVGDGDRAEAVDGPVGPAAGTEEVSARREILAAAEEAFDVEVMVELAEGRRGIGEGAGGAGPSSGHRGGPVPEAVEGGLGDPGLGGETADGVDTAANET